MEIHKILVPTDFSDSARYALDYAVSLAEKLQAEITLLHVVEEMTVGYTSDLFPVPMAEVFQEISSYARKALAGLVAAVGDRGVPVGESLSRGKAAHEIVREAREGIST